MLFVILSCFSLSIITLYLFYKSVYQLMADLKCEFAIRFVVDNRFLETGYGYTTADSSNPLAASSSSSGHFSSFGSKSIL